MFFNLKLEQVTEVLPYWVQHFQMEGVGPHLVGVR